MACYHPSVVSIARKSAANARLRVADRVKVPCGHCLGCRADQARSWAVRLVHEGEEPARPSWFVTLTYAPEKLPLNGTLNPRDPTLFFKRLRRAVEPERVSYYLCGEYGETTERPHYHAVLYGPEFLDRTVLTVRSGAPVFQSPSLEAAWGLGLCELTGLTFGAARYVAGYVRKKVRQRDSPDHYLRVDPSTGELVDLQKEYGRMSRRPALGRRWIERYWQDVYPRDFVVMEGKELKPPRYYDKWMDEDHVREPCPGGCRVHQSIMAEVREQRIKDAVEIGDDKLIMKEKVHRAKVALFQGRKAI